MPIMDAMKNRMLDIMDNDTPNATPRIQYMSLHSADPSTTGTNEVTGGSYARQTVSFAAASGGSITTSGPVSFTGLAGGTTVAWVGFWSAVTGGTFLASADIPTDDTFGVSGTYTVSSVTISL